MTNRIDQPHALPGYLGYREHVVGRGETLSAIARAHYGASDFHPVLRANPSQLADPDLIFPGQVLKIPIGAG